MSEIGATVRFAVEIGHGGRTDGRQDLLERRPRIAIPFGRSTCCPIDKLNIDDLPSNSRRFFNRSGFRLVKTETG